MKPGRELDALVAEKVMGEKNVCHELGVIKNDLGLKFEIPFYSTDVAAAWEIVDWWLRENEDSPFLGYRVFGYKGEVSFQFDDSHDAKFESGGESISHAICLAALKAKGVDV